MISRSRSPRAPCECCSPLSGRCRAGEGMMGFARGDRLSELLAVFLLGEAQLVLLLQVQPDVGAGAKPLAESEGRFGRDGPLTVDDLRDAVGGHVQCATERGCADAQLLELIRENLTGMNWWTRHRVLL